MNLYIACLISRFYIGSIWPNYSLFCIILLFILATHESTFKPEQRLGPVINWEANCTKLPLNKKRRSLSGACLKWKDERYCFGAAEYFTLHRYELVFQLICSQNFLISSRKPTTEQPKIFSLKLKLVESIRIYP